MPPPAASHPSGLLRESIARAFQDRFGRPPEFLAAAPGRVNLIGEHIDYNDGFVLPAAIDRQTVFAAAPRKDLRIAIHNAFSGQTLDLEAALPVPRAVAGSWENYLRGVLHTLLADGLTVPGFDAVLASEVPLGAGLSSSAALEVSFATALEGLAGEALPPQRKALLCQQAEHEFAGVPCGIMDQFAAVFGRAGCLLLLDCRSRDIEWIPFPDPSVCLLIANTNVRHALADGEYAIRRQQCSDALTQLGAISWREVDPGRLELFRRALPDPLYRRAKHVVTEIARTRAAAQAIRVADWDATRRLMAESHASLRDDYEVSCPELDCLVDIAADLPGVLGTRMTGGGFGGSTVSLVRHERLSEVEAALRDGYLARTGVEASLFVASPGDGASLFPIPGRPPLEAPES